MSPALFIPVTIVNPAPGTSIGVNVKLTEFTGACAPESGTKNSEMVSVKIAATHLIEPPDLQKAFTLVHLFWQIADLKTEPADVLKFHGRRTGVYAIRHSGS